MFLALSMVGSNRQTKRNTVICEVPRFPTYPRVRNSSPQIRNNLEIVPCNLEIVLQHGNLPHRKPA